MDLKNVIFNTGFLIMCFLAVIWYTTWRGNWARKKQTEEITTLLRDLNDKMDALKGIANDVEQIWFEMVRDKRTPEQRNEDAMWIDSQRPIDKP